MAAAVAQPQEIIIFVFQRINQMKKLFYLAALALLVGCKKDTNNQVPAPDKAPPINYSYTLTVINEPVMLEGDTIRIRINDVLIPVFTNTERYQHPTRIKTGDVISVYYNPGQVQYNGSAINDENDLRIYIDDMLLYEANCRCTVNVTKTIN